MVITMRIITGSARGTKLRTLDGLETRPTTEIVKEAVFSMIQFELDGKRVLDVFAGSGQLGLEALSRGASKATFIDSNRAATDIIKENALKTKLYSQCVIYNSDYKRMLKMFSGKEKFDIIFIDPPYAEKLIDNVLCELVRYDLIANGGIIICEDDAKEPYEHEKLSSRRHSKYGRTYITVLEKKDDLQ